MKVLFLSDDFPPASFGGAGISTYELARGILEAGHEVSIVTTVRTESEAGERSLDGLKVLRIASDYPEKWRAYRGLYNRRVIKKLEKIMEEIRPDVVHANNVHYHLSYHALKLSKRYAKRVVLTFRDTMAITYGKLETKRYLKSFDTKITWLDNLRQARKRWNPLRNLIIRYYLGYADKLLSVSEALALALEQNGIKNIEVMRTGIDLSDYPASPSLPDAKTVFFAGRLSEAKGSRAVEKAMQLVKKEMPEAKLLTAGSSGDWLDRKGIQKAYAASSVVLVPSLYLDPFPRVVLEAMALGKPVAGTCYGGAPEAILDGVTGYIVNPLEAKEMSEKILELLRDPSKAERFGQAGRARIKDEFNLNDRIAKLLSIYQELS